MASDDPPDRPRFERAASAKTPVSGRKQPAAGMAVDAAAAARHRIGPWEGLVRLLKVPVLSFRRHHRSVTSSTRGWYI